MRVSFTNKHKALTLFVNKRRSHTESLAAVGLPPDPRNQLLWGWGAEFERLGLYRENRIIPEEQLLYNAHCINCDAVFQPLFGSPLWWQAKERADAGMLDALHVTGEECGCIEKRICPDAPYRVLGYDDLHQDFDLPCSTFTEAIRTYLQHDRAGDVVFITGVSDAVESRLLYGR